MNRFSCNYYEAIIQEVEKSNIDPNKSKKGKLPLAEVHPDFEESLALVNELSKVKGYELLNWIKDDVKCYFVSYLVSAARRHINKFLKGEDYNIEIDQQGNQILEPKVLHVECAAYNLLMLAALFKQGRKDLDDRKFKNETP